MDGFFIRGWDPVFPGRGGTSAFFSGGRGGPLDQWDWGKENPGLKSNPQFITSFPIGGIIRTWGDAR